MILKPSIAAICTGLAIITTTPVLGNVIYSYTGNSFDNFSDPTLYTSSMSVTGTIELTGALLPSSYTEFNADDPASFVGFSFGDGINTATQVFDNRWWFKTDQTGNIIEWKVSTRGTNPDADPGSQNYEIHTSNGQNIQIEDYGTLYDSCDGCPAPRWGSSLTPGVWAMETVVPIPSAVWLFSSGLIGLIGLARRKKA